MSINLSSNFLLSANLPLDERTVAATIAIRNAIPAIQRFQGLTCYVVTGSSGGPENWQLQGGVANSNWVLVGGAGGVPIIRYISPTGNNANDGLTAGTPWLTPAYAISQITALAPSSAIINCATGTYTSVSFDAPSLKFNCDIFFVGDEAAPSNVTFQNTSISLIGLSNENSILKFYGINFAGGGSNVGIIHEAGSLFFRNCIATNFYTFYTANTSSCRLYIQGGLSDLNITSTDTGFSLTNGASIFVSNNITLTQNGSSIEQGILFNMMNAYFVPIGSNIYTLNCVPVTGSGWLFSAAGCFIYTGSFCDYNINDGTGLFDFIDTVLVSGQNCDYDLSATSGWMELKNNSILYDNSTCTWNVSASPLSPIQLNSGSHIISKNYVTIGGIIIGNDLVDYVEYGSDVSRTKYAYDARYYDTVTFSVFGQLPIGVTNNDLTPDGIASFPYQCYIASQPCEVVSISVKTRIPNSTLLVITDTYKVYKNDTSTSMTVDVTTSSTGTSTASALSLNTGDRLSIKVTSDALTNAEDITIAVVIRRIN